MAGFEPGSSIPDTDVMSTGQDSHNLLDAKCTYLCNQTQLIGFCVYLLQKQFRVTLTIRSQHGFPQNDALGINPKKFLEAVEASCKAFATCNKPFQRSSFTSFAYVPK
jgi:hypothetical protein